MEIIDNINRLLGDDLRQALKSSAKLKVAAASFSIYAFEALKQELEQIESLEFIFTLPTFSPGDVTDVARKERRQFHIPKAGRERDFYGSEFEVQLKNKLTQRAIAKECAAWMGKKARFRSNRGTAPMQQFAGVQTGDSASIYMPPHGFTAVDLGYQRGDAVSNIVNKFDEPEDTAVFLNLFDQIWNDAAKLEDLNEDVLPNDRTGYQDSLIWQKLFNFQRDAATGIINKLEAYNGCILADSVKINVEQIFKLISPATEIKTI